MALIGSRTDQRQATDPSPVRRWRAPFSPRERAGIIEKMPAGGTDESVPFRPHMAAFPLARGMRIRALSPGDGRGDSRIALVRIFVGRAERGNS